MSYMEEWRPIPGWEGHYSVSNHGRIRSEARIVPRKTGDFRRPEIIMRASPNPISGHMQICLKRGGQSHPCHVHRLVMLAFVGPLPNGMETLHADDDPSNNHLSNLRYGTRRENLLDLRRTKRLACPKGHAYTPDNSRIDRHGHRHCRACNKQRCAARNSQRKVIAA